MDQNRIGEFLRAKRDQTRPEDAGLTITSHRRVPGLRRDEVALLAGISTEYYTRLEQGRDRHPSAQVLDAVARALTLDAGATAHLHTLADPAPRQRRRARSRSERVRPGLAQLINTWHDTPAYIEGRYLDILAANPIAIALSPVFAPGSNVLRSVLLDPDAREAFPDWEGAVAGLVALLRSTTGADLDTPRLTELVGELSLKSDLFRRLWARHDVRPHPGHGPYRIDHPQVGDLRMEFDKFAVTGAEEQQLVIYHAEPGTESAEKLALLASLSPGNADTPAFAQSGPRRRNGC
ncbi:transcriptional regulator with XRE-family HTH domain [Lipingzhangella halophila]|uniref:Transcriptional regulator with XRE-family HTH domain n=1 Tax=Lipingzhangella halophila TaxID=1783352 RepID=A0A7W7RIS1_9ACTN|nr:helix-turn-helix domain-containing protein [Lipingzhangella halophila]MBB4932754.1 transcriptional regulator with XRE-family HTH domain [Lipingzhangella halophila]